MSFPVNQAKQNKGFVSCNPTVRANNVPTVTNFIIILKKKKKKKRRKKRKNHVHHCHHFDFVLKLGQS